MAFALIAIASGLLAFLFMPMPKLPKARPVVDDARPRMQQPEPEFDPLAFWLFPDWDSGPIDEPFWMRPLKQPVSRETWREASPIPLLYGRARLLAQPVEWGGAKLISKMKLSGRHIVEIEEADGDRRFVDSQNVPEGVNLPTR